MPLSDQIGKSILGPKNIKVFEDPEREINVFKLIEKLRKQEHDKNSSLRVSLNGISIINKISTVVEEITEEPISEEIDITIDTTLYRADSTLITADNI